MANDNNCPHEDGNAGGNDQYLYPVQAPVDFEFFPLHSSILSSLDFKNNIMAE